VGVVWFLYTLAQQYGGNCLNIGQHKRGIFRRENILGKRPHLPFHVQEEDRWREEK